MEIDVEKTAGIAVELERSSEAVKGIAGIVAKLATGERTAGRNYADVGDRIAAGFEGVEVSLLRWSEAGKDNAVRLRASISDYVGMDGNVAQDVSSRAGER